MDSLVSIVIPCYNSAATVARAIESGLNQDYASVEVIVVDDGSTDESAEVLKRYDKQISWLSIENSGACAARNVGWKAANGDFIQFLDADDFLSAVKLSRQMEVVTKNEETLVFCDGTYINSDSKHPHHERNDVYADSLVFMLRGGLQTSAPIHRRSWLEAVGGWNEALPCSQERDLHVRIAALGTPFHRLPETLFFIEATQGSLSSSYERVLDQHLALAESVLTKLHSTDRLTDLYRREIAGFLARDARAYLKLGRPQKASRYFSRAAEIHSGGGLDIAYTPKTKWMRSWLGANLTEKLCAMRQAKGSR